MYGITDKGSYNALKPLEQVNDSLKNARKLSVVRVADNIVYIMVQIAQAGAAGGAYFYKVDIDNKGGMTFSNLHSI